jgi:hypothetical protein
MPNHLSRLLPAVLVAVAALTPCARAEPLRLDGFFKGSFTGTGEVDNYRDGTHRPFTATMRANWTGPRGTLVEDLVYADGEKKHFVWTFDKAEDGHFVGHRDDLIHDADIVQDGDIVRMKYTAKTRLPSGKIYILSFDDHLAQTSPTTVTLQGDVSYLFIGVGVTHMTITRTAH